MLLTSFTLEAGQKTWDKTIFNDILDELSQQPGAPGDATRALLANPPQLGEGTDAFSTRLNNEAVQGLRDANTQAQQSAKVQRIKVKDFLSRGLAPITTPQGQLNVVRDEANVPLEHFDKRHNIGYDSTGMPRKVGFDFNEGAPVLSDPYADAPQVTDKKTGDIYKTPAGLPWNWSGQDENIVAQNQAKAEAKAQKQTDTLNRETATALAAPEAELRAATKVAGKTLKASGQNLTAQLTAAGVPTYDATGKPIDFTSADPEAIKGQIDSAYAATLRSPEANKKKWFGDGLTPEAQNLRQTAEQSRTNALDALTEHAQNLGAAQQTRGALEQVKAQRSELTSDRLAAINEKRVAAGLAPVGLPNTGAQSNGAQEEPAPDTTALQPESLTPEEHAAAAAQPALPAPDKSGKPQAEGFWGTLGRAFASKIFPALGTAVGGLGAGALAIESGPGAIVADIAGGTAGGLATAAAQRKVMGAQWAEANQAQMQTNAQTHPVADQIGTMVPFLLSLLGGGGGLVKAAGGKVIGRAVTADGKAAVMEAAQKGEPYVAPLFERVATHAAMGARAATSEGAQEKYVESKDVSVLDAGAKGAVEFGALGLFPAAKTMLSMAGFGKSVGDAAAMTLAGEIYDAGVHGKPLTLEETAQQFGGNASAFVIQNALLGLLHRATLRRPGSSGEEGAEGGEDGQPPAPTQPQKPSSLGEWLNRIDIRLAQMHNDTTGADHTFETNKLKDLRETIKNAPPEEAKPTAEQPAAEQPAIPTFNVGDTLTASSRPGGASYSVMRAENGEVDIGNNGRVFKTLKADDVAGGIAKGDWTHTPTPTSEAPPAKPATGTAPTDENAQRIAALQAERAQHEQTIVNPPQTQMDAGLQDAARKRISEIDTQLSQLTQEKPNASKITSPTQVDQQPGGTQGAGGKGSGRVEPSEQRTQASAEGQAEAAPAVPVLGEKPPELMTPDEYVESFGKRPKGFDPNDTRVPKRISARMVKDASGKVIQTSEHGAVIIKAATEHKPVNAAAVEADKITLPKGYVREGENYVYKPAVPATGEAKATPAQHEVHKPSVKAEPVPSQEPPKPKRDVRGRDMLKEHPAKPNEPPEPIPGASFDQQRDAMLKTPLNVTPEQVKDARTRMMNEVSKQGLAALMRNKVIRFLSAKDPRQGTGMVTDPKTGEITVHPGELAESLAALDDEKAKADYVADGLDHELRHHITIKALTHAEIEATGKNLTKAERDALESLYGAKFTGDDWRAGAEAIAFFGQARDAHNVEAFHLFTDKARHDAGFAALIRKWLDYARNLAKELTGKLSDRLKQSIDRVQSVLDEIKSEREKPYDEQKDVVSNTAESVSPKASAKESSTATTEKPSRKPADLASGKNQPEIKPASEPTKPEPKSATSLESLKSQVAKILIEQRDFHPDDAAKYAEMLGEKKELTGFISDNTPDTTASEPAQHEPDHVTQARKLFNGLFSPSPVYVADLKQQAQWLESNAKKRGHDSVAEFALSEPDLFAKLTAGWRNSHSITESQARERNPQTIFNAVRDGRSIEDVSRDYAIPADKVEAIYDAVLRSRGALAAPSAGGGYRDDFSKSNRAARAESEGRFPATEVARRLGVPVGFIKEHAPTTGEWHHTSKFYNSTPYYDFARVEDWLNGRGDFEPQGDEPTGNDLLAEYNTNQKALKSNAPDKLTEQTIKFLEWSGTKNHPHATERVIENVIIERKPGQKMVTITTASGATFKKSLETRGFEIKDRIDGKFSSAEGVFRRAMDLAKNTIQFPGLPEGFAVRRLPHPMGEEHTEYFVINPQGVAAYPANEIAGKSPHEAVDKFEQRQGTSLAAPSPSGETYEDIIPPERAPQLVETARSLVANTHTASPDGLAKFLGEQFGGKANRYTQSLWHMMKALGANGASEPDWKAIFAKLAPVLAQTKQESPQIEPAAQIEQIAASQKETKAAKRLASAPETSPAKLKVQKAYLLDALDKAIGDAPESLPTVKADTDIAKIKGAYGYGEGRTSDYEQALYNLSELATKYSVPGIEPQESELRKLFTEGQEQKGIFLGYGDSRHPLDPAARFDLMLMMAEEARQKQLPHITIEVPGDGSFTIVNSKDALTKFRDIAKKQFPVNTAKPDRIGSPNVRIESTKIPELGKPKAAGDYIKIAGIAVSKDTTREVLMNVFSDGKHVIAIDGRRLIVLDAKAGGSEANPLLFNPSTLKTTAKDSDGEPWKFPNWKQVIPNPDKQHVITTLDTGALMKLLIQAKQMTSEKSNSVALWLDDKGKLGVTSNTPDVGMYSGGDADPQTAKFIAAYNPDFLLDGLRIARALGHNKATWNGSTTPQGKYTGGHIYAENPATFEAKGMKYVLMPMRIDGGTSVHPLAEGAKQFEPKEKEQPKDAPKAKPPTEPIPPVEAEKTSDEIYDAARAKWSAASKAFTKVKTAFRTKEATGDEYAAAMREFKGAQDAFDKAESDYIAAKNEAATPAEKVEAEQFPLMETERSKAPEIARLRKILAKLDVALDNENKNAGQLDKLEATRKKIAARLNEAEKAAAQAPAQQPASTSKAEPNEKKGIHDFGAKLGGARKDIAASMKRGFSDDDIARMPLSEIWPKSDVEAIEDIPLAALATAVRAEIPSKPRQGYKVRQWAEKVRQVRGLMRIAGEQGYDAVLKKMGDYRLEQLINKINLLQSVPREHWGRIGRVEDRPDAYRYKQDAEGKQVFENGKMATIPTPFSVADVDGKIIRAPNLAELTDKLNAALGSEAPPERMKFEVRGREGKGWFINKTGDPLYRKLKTFEDSKTAVDFVRNPENYAALVSAWDAVKQSDNVKETDVRRETNRDRSGKDWRNGKDATPEMFMDAFGFRGAEFGNWVSQGKNIKERQGMLNAAYDALNDLAQIVNIPPKAISLNGTLGLGFGSRGHGWASAHYEPSNLVINLTKTRGAGSLAHEWFHALDNYFQRKRNEAGIVGRHGDYITEQPETYYESPSGQRLSETRYKELAARPYNAEAMKEWNRVEGVRPEVAEAFLDLVKALNASPMAKRAALIDKGKSDGYWSRAIERAARSFENCVIAKMQLNGDSNDYLANVQSVEDFTRDKGRYPYLLPDELAPLSEAFDNLFRTIQTKETDKGIALAAPKPADAKRLRQLALIESRRALSDREQEEKRAIEGRAATANQYDDNKNTRISPAIGQRGLLGVRGADQQSRGAGQTKTWRNPVTGEYFPLGGMSAGGDEVSGNEASSTPETQAGGSNPPPNKPPARSTASASDEPLGAPNPFRDFYDKDVAPVTRGVWGGFKEAMQGIKHLLSPTSDVDSAAMDTLMRELGNRNKAQYIVNRTLAAARKGFDKMGRTEQIAFIDRVKTGEAQPTPELQAIADTIRAIDTASWKAAQDAYRELGYADDEIPLKWLENHYRVLWKVIPGSDEARKMPPGAGNRPLQGSKGMLKQHTLADMSEGLAMGGEPFSYNPVVMFQTAQADIWKLTTALRIWKFALDNGFAKFEKGKFPKLDAGRVWLNDNISRVYFKVPQGTVEPGRYSVEKQFGRVLNNFLSADLIRQSQLGKGLLWVKTFTTQAELFLSLFHGVFEGLEAVGSQIGLGLGKLWNRGLLKGSGEAVFDGLKDIITSFGAPVTGQKLGSTVRRLAALDDPTSDPHWGAFIRQFPEAKRMLKALFSGGWKPTELDQDWKNNSIRAFVDSLADIKAGTGSNYIGAALRALPAANEMLMKPLFDHFIPNLKLAAFFKEFQEGLKTNHTLSDEALARQSWRFVEDRFGELNYDTLFWNRTFKTAMQLMFRSVTWKLGSIEAFSNAFGGQAREFKNAFNERRAPELHRNMAWLLGMFALTAAIGYTISKALGHHDPENLTDVVFPRYDEKEPKLRVSIPTYWKDLVHLLHSPANYVKASSAGWIGRVADLLQNQDYYGMKIRNTDDDATKQALQVSKFAAESLLPFSVRGYQNLSANQVSGARKAMAAFGVNPAPRYIGQTKAETLAADYWKGQKPVDGISPEAFERQMDKRKLVEQIRHNAPVNITHAIQSGTIKPRDVKELYSRAATSPLKYGVSRMPLEEAERVFAKANPDERQELMPIMVSKRANTAKRNAPPALPAFKF